MVVLGQAGLSLGDLGQLSVQRVFQANHLIAAGLSLGGQRGGAFGQGFLARLAPGDIGPQARLAFAGGALILQGCLALF